ncbi:MAG: DUF2288 domain-containing protein [Byssovorax sp.]
MRDELLATMGEVLWSDLQAHAKRDAIIVVGAALDLLDVGEAVAKNEAGRVEAWIQSGQIRKPTADDLRRWPADPGARFLSLIVQPFVLIRPVLRLDPTSN